MIFTIYLRKIVKARYLSRRIVYLSDLILSLSSSFLALCFLDFASTFQSSVSEILFVLAGSLLASAFSFSFFKIYKGIIRYSAYTETGRIAIAVLLKELLLAIIIVGMLPHFQFRILVCGFLTDTFLTFFLLTIIRSLMIFTYHSVMNHTTRNMHRMLIYKTPGHAVSFSNKVYQIQSKTYQISGYIRYGEAEKIRIGGFPVNHFLCEMDFRKLLRRKDFSAILFPDRADLQNEKERLVLYCEKHNIKMLLLPPCNEVTEGSTSFNYLPEVRIEDLLGRDEIQINMQEIARRLNGKTVLVTGAAGSIGSEICRQLCRFGLKQLILFDNAETPMHTLRLELEEKYPALDIQPIIGDVRIADRIEYIFAKFRPQYIYHAAAYKHVPLMEENPCEAIHTNVYGTRNVADMAIKYGAEKFVMISTDKAVNPTNVMGTSKRLAEIYIQSLGTAIHNGQHPGSTRFVTTRFGNVLGSNGSVIPRFREQLQHGGPITVTHPDIIRYFMTIPEACRLVLEASFLSQGNEIFVFDMGQPVKIADLARRMICLAGLIPGVDIDIQYTGLRPGEKLYEELLACKEKDTSTTNEKIFRARIREYNYLEIVPQMVALIESAMQGNRLQTVRQMKAMVPEFKSQNSAQFEILDKEQEQQELVTNKQLA